MDVPGRTIAGRDRREVSVALISLDGILIAAHETGGAGFHGAEAVGRPVWEALWCTRKRTERLRLQEDVVRAAKGSAVSTRVTLPVSARGTATTVELHLTPLRDATGAVRFILGLVADSVTVVQPGLLLPDDLTSRLVHRINNSVNGVKAALAVLRHAVPADAQDVRLLHLVDMELDLLADVAREVSDTHGRGP